MINYNRLRCEIKRDLAEYRYFINCHPAGAKTRQTDTWGTVFILKLHFAKTKHVPLNCGQSAHPL